MTDIKQAVTVDADSEAINTIAGKLEKALEGERRDYSIAALFSLGVFLQNPAIAPEKLIDIVENTLKFCCMQLIEDDMQASTNAANGSAPEQLKIVLTDPETLN